MPELNDVTGFAQKNWKAIVIALLVIVLLALIITMASNASNETFLDKVKDMWNKM